MRRRRPDPGQASFDLDGLQDLAEAEAEAALDAAPAGFTTVFWPAAALDAAFQRWQLRFGQSGSVPRSHMWHRALGADRTVGTGGHSAAMFSADLRCQPGQHPEGDCLCAGALMVRIGCDPCGWQAIGSSENVVVERWHDHAFPDWRSLPVVPARLVSADRSDPGGRAARWLEEHYPVTARVPGAPILTERRGSGLRHVPGGSPWGGWDIAAAGVERGGDLQAASALRPTVVKPFRSRGMGAAAPVRRPLSR